MPAVEEVVEEDTEAEVVDAVEEAEVELLFAQPEVLEQVELTYATILETNTSD